ncbi:MAG: ATP-binding protein [Planctomycetota bacterium]
MTQPSSAELHAERAEKNFREHQQRIQAATSRTLAWLLIVQWPAGIAVALFVSPHTWRGTESIVHTHVWAAFFLGFLLSSLPAYLAWRAPTSATTHHVVAVAQMLWSALLIHLTGGRIETHFHVFGSLAVLAFYRDWRVLTSAVVIVAADHFIRGIWWPVSVFGVLLDSQYRWIEHAAWVLFESFFLVQACRRSVTEMRGIAEQQALLEVTNVRIEQEVAERTVDLKRAHQAAMAADQVKSDFLANMSHEIRTPMNSILGFAELLDSPDRSPEDVRDYVATIRRNGQHLLTIINDILDISKIEAGMLEVETLPTSVAGVISEVIELLHVRASEKGLLLCAEYKTPVPESVSTDPVRLRQILMNLVGNAVKFTEKGNVTVVCEVIERGGAKKLAISVCDTGIGLSREQKARLFRAFTQADVSTTRQYGGSGLGLTISKRLAHKLGGDIEVDSAVGEGSTFRVLLSPPDLATTTMIDPTTAAATTGASQQQDPQAETLLAATDNIRAAKILVADDGADNRRLILAYLRKGPFEIETAENGAVAVDKWKSSVAAESPYDIILLDMQMPVLDGYEAAGQLRALNCSAAVVALTAHAMTGARERCLDAGCDDFLSKPVRRSALLAKLNEVLADRKLQPQD